VIVWVELSGENPPLARAELGAVAALSGGSLVEDPRLPSGPRYAALEMPDLGTVPRAAERVALAHRFLVPVLSTDGPGFPAAVTGAARGAPSVDVRWMPPAPEGATGLLDGAKTALRDAGFTIRSRSPPRCLWCTGDPEGSIVLAEEAARVDREAFSARRMPKMPFQRPVSLAPRLARAAVNLAGVRAGDRVADPFVGTGALLLEAGLLGARMFGSDRDATMIRGCLQNFRSVGVEAEALVVADAEAAAAQLPWPELDALVTDPPYGRASSAGGEPPGALVRRVLPRWAEHVRAGGAIVLVGPAGPDPLGAPWRRVIGVADRVHRSLTREFRVYRRAGEH
jgi:hypothetical protein